MFEAIKGINLQNYRSNLLTKYFVKHESTREIEDELRFGTRFNRLAGITSGDDVSFSQPARLIRS